MKDAATSTDSSTKTIAVESIMIASSVSEVKDTALQVLYVGKNPVRR